MSLFKDEDGIWHKILTSEHVTKEIIEKRVEFLKKSIAHLQEELEKALKDLEDITRG